ncbi:MAG: AsmA family protein, partial [Pseudomonadota bacterium]
MNAFFLTIGTLLTAVLVALFAIPPFIDWNTYRGVFEVEASRLIGRDVRVRGDVNLRLLPQPYVSFEDLVIANPPGMLGEPFLRAKTFTMRLSVPPLLSGAIEARDIVIEQPSIRLRLTEDGRGNWQSLGQGSRVSGANVSLKQVAVTKGDVTLESAKGEAVASVSDISGDFSAEALSGPYKFEGQASLAGAMRDVRLSTGSLDADGKLPLKLNARAGDGSGSLTLDGDLTSLSGDQPKFAGRLALNVAKLTALEGDASAVAPIEVSAEVNVDAEQVALEGISILFDQQRRSQELTGTARLPVSGNNDATITLTARWLDLDRIAGSADNAGASSNLEARAIRLGEALSALAGAGSERKTLALVAEQATLGGSEVSALALNATFSAGRVTLNRLGLRGPGGTELNLDGTGRIGTDGTLQEFRGALLADGGNSVRFANWLAPGLGKLDGVAPRRFAINARLVREGALTAIEDGRMMLGGRRFLVNYALDRGTAGKQTLSIASADLDLRALAPGLLQPDKLRTLLRKGLDRDDGASGAEFDFSLRADRVRDGTTTARDVDIAVTRAGPLLTIRRAKMTSGAGYNLDISGTIANVAAPTASALNGTVGVEDRASATALVSFMTALTGRQFAEFGSIVPTPARVGFSLRERTEGPERLALAMSGTVRGDQVSLDLTSDKPLDDWRSAEISLKSNVVGANADAALAWMTGRNAIPKTQSPTEAGGKPAPIKVTLIAEGPVAKGLKTLASVNNGASSARFAGT